MPGKVVQQNTAITRLKGCVRQFRLPCSGREEVYLGAFNRSVKITEAYLGELKYCCEVCVCVCVIF